MYAYQVWSCDYYFDYLPRLSEEVRLESFNDTFSLQREKLSEAPTALSVHFLSHISLYPGSFVLTVLCFPFALMEL